MSLATKVNFTKEYGYIYILRLLGAGSNKLYDLLSVGEDLEQICKMTDAEWRKIGLLTEGELARLKKINSNDIYKTLDYCKQNNIRIITPEDDEYPLGFRSIENPPAVLFARGDRLDSTAPTIGIVGSRKCTEFGEKAAYSLSAKLALSGFTVISGGAKGIDNMAHVGAMNAGGKTIVVLGCGIDSNYLMQQEPMRKRAEQNGTIISEFEPKASAAKYTFPIRNRLISALSCGVAVIEAGHKSGALITATYAMEQGKEVFALPGNIDLPQYGGTNELLRDGALPLLSVEDIIEVYIGRFSDKLKTDVTMPLKVRRGYAVEAERFLNAKPKSEKRIVKESVVNEVATLSNSQIATTPLSELACSNNAKQVYAAFKEKTELSDTLISRSSVSGSDFIAAVTELELFGYIKAVPVGRYQIIK